jgi:archaellum component FlaC
MKNIQFVNVFSIIACLLAVTMLVFVIRNYQNANKVAAALEAAQSSAKTANEEKEKAIKETLDLKELIDGVENVALDVKSFQENHKKDMWKFSPDDAGKRDYRAVLSRLYDELDATKKEHEQTKTAMNQLEADYKNLQTLYSTVAQKHDKERAKAITDLEGERKKFQNTLTTFSERLGKVENEKIAIQTKSSEDLKKATDETTRERTRAEKAEELGGELGAKLQQLLRPIFDRPDGVIEVVDLNTRAVIVDIGFADGVETRMTFSVYDPKIAGISYDTSLYGDNPVLCEACKRNVSLHASKASIEIIRVLGPHRSEARIIIDQLVNPILVGDVIHSPIWDRGQMLRIALGAGMFLPDVGNPAGDPSLGSLADVKNMIIECGGKVDSYISDGRIDDKKRGTVIGLDNITADTSFIVIGTVQEGKQEPEIMAAQDAMRKKAKALAVKEISLKELMLKIGWRNPTPLKDYGTTADQFDYRIKPEGGRRLSSGIVSPIYDKPNYSAGISINDKNKTYQYGKVSDLYDKKPSKSLSSGNVSELFRQRKPKTDLTNP